MLRQSVSHPTSDPCQQDALLKVTGFLSRHCHEKTDLSQVADGVHLSEEDVDALFRRFKGKSAADALLEYKLNGLCNRLGSDLESPIETLMEECGLNPGADSCAAFERSFGITVQEYRRQYRVITRKGTA